MKPSVISAGKHNGWQARENIKPVISAQKHSDGPGKGGGGTRYILGWGGAARPLIQITDFPTLLKRELRFLIPCLRHLKFCGYKKLCGFVVV